MLTEIEYLIYLQVIQKLLCRPYVFFIFKFLFYLPLSEGKKRESVKERKHILGHIFLCSYSQSHLRVRTMEGLIDTIGVANTADICFVDK